MVNNNTSSEYSIALPPSHKIYYDLEEALFPLHRQIEKTYGSLPWPDSMRNIVVFTEVKGGRGDIAAATKAIAVMQGMSAHLNFDWLIKNAQRECYDPEAFLTNRSRVQVRYLDDDNIENELPGDFLLTGPFIYTWDKDYAEDCLLMRKIAGPTFSFLENANGYFTFDTNDLQNIAQEDFNKSIGDIYQSLHLHIFPNQSQKYKGLLSMGLQPGSGIFLDRGRLEAPLSRGHCCPSYIAHIADDELRQDICIAMDTKQNLPDYDRYSFNFGYAHRPASWGKYIDCVAIHEKDKSVVIVLNQVGELDQLSNAEFQQQILNVDRLHFLQQKGFSRILFKGQGQESVTLKDGEPGRSLTVIIRPSFCPNDMKQMQLAAERLMATGDNSAVEAWCARCKLYLYEDVNNNGYKWRFLQQQVDLAKNISPNLSQLLALFGDDRRLPGNDINQPLNAQKMEQLETLLNDPTLGDATMQLCEHITTNYAFDKVFEAAIKRAAWHHCIPELAQIESQSLDDVFKNTIVNLLNDFADAPALLPVRGIDLLNQRVQAAVLAAAKE